MKDPLSADDSVGEAQALKGERGLRRVYNALRYSLAGMRTAFGDEAAFRQLLWLNAGLLPLALWLDVSGTQRALLMVMPLLCLVVELLNTAIENVVDRVSMDLHPKSKNAKDMGSAAQLVCLMMVLVSWLSVLA